MSVSVRTSPWKYLDFARILSTLMMASFTVNALASSRKDPSGTLLLRCGKAGLVDSVVQLIVDPLIALFDLVYQAGRSQVERGILANVVELAIQHLDDVCAFVVHNCLCELVPQDRNGKPARVLRVCFKVDVLEKVRVKRGISGAPIERSFALVKSPACIRLGPAVPCPSSK